MVENSLGQINVTEVSGELEDSTCSICVPDETSKDHLREYLAQLFEILAFGQMGL